MRTSILAFNIIQDVLDYLKDMARAWLAPTFGCKGMISRRPHVYLHLTRLQCCTALGELFSGLHELCRFGCESRLP